MSCLFSTNLKRFSLLKEPVLDCQNKFKINVHRNHSFEMVDSVILKFLNLSDIQIEFKYSDYDDSLNFADFKKSDLEFIWLDLDRYKTDDIASWLVERVAYLRSLTDKDIIVACLGNKNLNNSFDGLQKVHYYSVNELLNYIPESDLYDLAKEPFTGTRLSNQANLQLARIFGCRILPAFFKTPLKAIVFDLDNTLYKGILGEDGVENLTITEYHKKSYELIHDLMKQGFMICLASKNDEDAVRDFVLQSKEFDFDFKDFAATEINWNNKAENILKIAHKINIGTDAILFLDDNPAEIQNVELASVGCKTCLVESDEELYNILRFYPGFYKLKTTAEDSIRTKDIQANEKRQQLLNTVSTEEYFKQLQIELTFYVDQEKYIPRISQLLNKTNQFIFNYGRFSEDQVREFVQSKDHVVIGVSMSDKLSDSGIIAILVATKSDNHLFVKDVVISCRALGRRLEDVLIFKSLKLAAKKLNTDDTVVFPYQHGPRNKPALTWLDKHSNIEDHDGAVELDVNTTLEVEGLKIKIEK